jgi:CDP-diglyceride synthetase
MRDVLKYYMPMLVLLISGMFLIHAEDLTEGKFLTAAGLYILFSLVLFANMVSIRVVYSARSRNIIRATTFLSLLLNAYPSFYMLITQTADPLIIFSQLIVVAYSSFAAFDRG